MDLVSNNTAVLYLTDANYFQLTQLSIASVVLHGRNSFDFHIFTFDFHATLNAEVSSLLDRHSHSCKIHYVSDELRERFGDYSDVSLYDHISKPTLYKADVIQLLSESYREIIYLDPDVMAFRSFDVNDVFGFHQAVASVYDFVSYMRYDNQDIRSFARASELSEDYFNAGVMFINAAAWREAHVADCYREYLIAHNSECPYRRDTSGQPDRGCKGADQCALNMSLSGNWFQLPFEWDAQKPVRHTSIWRDAILRHYTGKHKITTTTSRYRDRREARLLARINRLLPAITRGHYRFLFGVPFLIDRIRYWKETMLYNAILNDLGVRMKILVKKAH